MQAHLFLVERSKFDEAVGQLAQEGLAFVKLGASADYVAIAVADNEKMPPVEIVDSPIPALEDKKEGE